MSAPRGRSFVRQWLLTTLGALVAANIVPGIRCESFLGLLAASLILGILNAIFRPILIVLSLPLVIVSLGLFMLVINALLVYFVGWLVRPFHVETFWAAFWGGLVISIVAMLAGRLTDPPTTYQGSSPPAPPPGQGPVIDV